MALKFPPPPTLAAKDPETQRLNRWLIEIQSILNSDGTVNIGDSPVLTGVPTAPTAANGTDTTQIATTAFVINNAGTPATTVPLVDATPGQIGASTHFARGDHVHPTDTSRAPLASPALTGAPTAPTAAPGTNTTEIATTAFVEAAIASGGVGGGPDVIVEEQQSSGTSGGASTTGTFVTRALNTLVRNNGSIASLASSQVTLGAGTYYFSWSAPGFFVAQHKTRLQNITDGTTAALGTSEWSTNALADTAQSRSFGSTVVTIAATKAFALQHQFGAVKALNGLGVAGSFGTEIYSRLEIKKLA